MTKRKGKTTTKQDDDSLLLLESSVAQPRGLKEYAVPAVVVCIFAFVGLTAVWFCCQQQQTIDSLTETANAMQLRITKFQQQLGMGNAQITNVGVFEERLQALEEAYTQAQMKAEVTLATSEKIQSTDLSSQLWSLQSEMNAKLSKLQQTTVSTATVNAVVKNKTNELEKLKQRLDSTLNANSEVAVSISGLTDTVLVTKSCLDEQMSTVEGITSQLEEQRMELAVLKESFASIQNALERNRQEVLDIKELLEMEQARRAQALEEQLMSVRRSLEDHQKSTHNLHSHLAAQLVIVQSQMLAQSQQLDSVEEEILEEQAATEEDFPIKAEEIEVNDKTVMEEREITGDVQVQEEFVEDQVVSEEEGPVGGVQVQVEVVEEQAKRDVIPEEVLLQKDVFEEEAVPKGLQVKEEVVAQQPSKELSEKVQVQGEEAVEEQALTEEDVISEDVQVKHGDVAGEESVSKEDKITEKVQFHWEEALEERTEGAEKDLTSTEETEIEAEAAKDVSDNQVVGDLCQEETPQESFEETVEKN
ncbi:myosin-3-like [Myxocyprinus asiaticus]|uniref:myosin-3-like n=1 Tax=Myxocyprinus asiaticus TaxID=70543 RepID=UPI002221CB19|nr:myosin-3-like [Myxocyprinus asiaticus]